MAQRCRNRILIENPVLNDTFCNYPLAVDVANVAVQVLERELDIDVYKRQDYRLLHWQTGVLWVQKLKANMILVAGDKVAADDMRKNLIKLAAPKSVKTRIVPIAEAAAFLTSENVKKYSIEPVSSTHIVRHWI